MDGTEPSSNLEGGGLAASPFFALYKLIFALSVLGVLGLTLVEGIVVVRGEVERSSCLCHFLVALSWLQGSVATFIRTDLLLLISSKSIKG